MEYVFNARSRTKGIVFGRKSRLRIADGDSGSGTVYVSMATDIVKIGHTDKMGNVDSFGDADPIAKAYFSATTFKAGDEVVIARKPEPSEEAKHYKWVSNMDAYIGNTMKIKYIGEDFAIMENSSFRFPLVSLELAKAFTPDPDKSYEDNQAAWCKFYDIKIGSKVKVVRPYKTDEMGCDASAVDQHWLDRHPVGAIVEIKKLCLRIGGDDMTVNHPYFALEPA